MQLTNEFHRIVVFLRGIVNMKRQMLSFVMYFTTFCCVANSVSFEDQNHYYIFLCSMFTLFISSILD